MVQNNRAGPHHKSYRGCCLKLILAPQELGWQSFHFIIITDCPNQNLEPECNSDSDILNTCTWEHLSQHFFIFWLTPWHRHSLHRGKSYTTQDRQSSHSNELHLVQAREEVPTSSCTALHQWAVVHLQVSDPGEGCTKQSKVDLSTVLYFQAVHCRKDDTWHTHNRCLRTLLQHRCAAVSCTEFQGKVRRMKSIFGRINCGIIITINNNSVSGDVWFF